MKFLRLVAVALALLVTACMPNHAPLSSSASDNVVIKRTSSVAI
jgi:hypothetical protein